MTFGAHLRVIANTSQQAIGDARRAPATSRDLFSAIQIQRHSQQLCGAFHNCRQLGHSIMIQAQHQTEASAQGSAHQTLPRGGADGGEVRNGNGMRARARARANQNIHAKVFQRSVEDLLYIRKQAMNFVDEENLTRMDVGEHARQIELLLENGAGGLFKIDTEFAGDNRRERCFA